MWENGMTTIDPQQLQEQLSAYLDNELSDADRIAVQELLQTSPVARARLEKLRETVAWVAELPRRGAPETLNADVMSRIERSHLLDGETSLATKSTVKWRSFRPFLAAAAMVTVAVGVGLWGISESGDQLRESHRLAMVQSVTSPLDSALPPGEREQSVEKETGATPSAEQAGSRETSAFDRLAKLESQTRDKAGRIDRVFLDADEKSLADAAEANKPIVAVDVSVAQPFGLTGGRVELREGAATTMTAAPAMVARIDSRKSESARNVEDQVEFRIAYADRAALEVGSKRLHGFLRDQRPPAIAVNSPLSRAPKNDWPDAGSAGVRRVDSTHADIWQVEHSVRLPVSQPRQLVDEMQSVESENADVSLSIGPVIRSYGWQKTSQLLDAVDGTAGSRQAGGPRSAITADDEFDQRQPRRSGRPGQREPWHPGAEGRRQQR